MNDKQETCDIFLNVMELLKELDCDEALDILARATSCYLTSYGDHPLMESEYIDYLKEYCAMNVDILKEKGFI